MATVLVGEGVSDEWMRKQLGEWLVRRGMPIFILKQVLLQHLFKINFVTRCTHKNHFLKH